MIFETILFERRDQVAHVTLNRPDKLNALNLQMIEDLRAAAAAIDGDPAVRAALLTGAGRGFSSGADLMGDDLLQDPKRSAGENIGRRLRDHFNPMVTAWHDLRIPLVVAVNGVAAGAGANIALACDLVIAAKSASFIQAFCKIGLIPDAGGTYFLPRLIGSARAMGLALSGDKLSAEQAAAWGLIWKCVDDAEFPEAVESLAAQLAQAPTLGLGAIKRALYASADNSLEAQLDLERDLQRELGYSADYREGVTAFLEKRAPRFTGK